MNVKALTMTIAIALIATTAMPIAAAHWRGDYVHRIDTTTNPPTLVNVPVKTIGANWTGPHEHIFALHSGNAPSIYSGNFQRMCLNTSVTPPNLTWGTQNGCDVPVQGGVFPPVRGVGLGLTNCFDLDSFVDFGAGAVDLGVRVSGVSSVILDWGVAAVPLTGTYNFADYFAHPNKARFPLIDGDDPNPTGATPTIAASGLPWHVLTVPGVIQADITYTGLGWDGTGTGGSSFPGVDVGDNDNEACTGGASHTYAINSGDDLNALNTTSGLPEVIRWAGAGLNDLRNIGGDLTFDITPGKGTGTGGSSAVVHTGGTVPASAALGPDGLPLGALLNITEINGNKSIPYSVCNGLVGAGCTNIPETGSGVRLNNSLEGNAVYSSLQDCVWHWNAFPDRAHNVSARNYTGVQALWGTATPAGTGDGTCWPERLVRSGPLVTSIYLPSSLTPIAAWNPDDLPATYAGVEAYTVFVDEATMKNFDGFDSGCPQYSQVDPTAACFDPEFGAPITWFDAPNTLVGFSAIFQE